MQIQGEIGMAHVPWPLGEVLPGADAMTPADFKLAVRDLLRRWHPDKFSQRFGARLCAADRDAVLRRVVVLAQEVNSLQGV
jgi:hypothetical protein